MQTLIGSYECKADVKGRLMLPVGLKKQLAASLSSGFVLKRFNLLTFCIKLSHSTKE